LRWWRDGNVAGNREAGSREAGNARRGNAFARSKAQSIDF